jgi:ribosomal protein L18
MRTDLKVVGRKIRHLRVRTKVQGTAARPRLAVYRSLNHIYAQVVDDAAGRTLVSVDSRSPDFRGKAKSGGNVAAAKIVRARGAESQGRRHRPGRLRSRRLPVPRAGQSSRRTARAAGWLLMGADC